MMDKAVIRLQDLNPSIFAIVDEIRSVRVKNHTLIKLVAPEANQSRLNKTLHLDKLFLLLTNQSYRKFLHQLPTNCTLN